MMIHEVTAKAGAYKKSKRLGRGIGSGKGKTCGRGTKGAGSRSGWTGSIRPGREGGQTAFFRRIPKRGFSNFNFRTEYNVVNLRTLDANFKAGETVDRAALLKAGLIPGGDLPLKVLGDGEIGKKLTVVADAFSKSAQEKIAKAGGQTTVAGK